MIYIIPVLVALFVGTLIGCWVSYYLQPCPKKVYFVKDGYSVVVQILENNITLFLQEERIDFEPSLLPWSYFVSGIGQFDLPDDKKLLN